MSRKEGINPPTSGVAPPAAERCSNPWNPQCKNLNIALFIIYKREQLPICRSCWSGIADSEIEWDGEATR